MDTKKIIRRKFLNCRVSSSEKDRILQDALNEKKDVSTYIREKLLPDTKE